ncbi:MAG TPA: hypothetical protein VKG25_12470 [Bryobacteraceae bacterium]|nr:hypothetical protein [Bryobacteraceae bacterium]
MTQLHVEHCELTYEGAFARPAFSLNDSPGAICDSLLGALEPFGCTGADLTLIEGEPGERGVACEIVELETQVTFHGDRIEIYCPDYARRTATDLARVLNSLWSGLAGADNRVLAKTHSFRFEADGAIREASYQQVLNRFAPAPSSLPAGTESAVVYYLPAEPNQGYAESSLVLNRSVGLNHGLQVDATLVYEAQVVAPAVALSSAQTRLGELLLQLGVDWIED